MALIVLVILVAVIRRSRRESRNAGLSAQNSRPGNPISRFLGLASSNHDYEATSGDDSHNHQLNSTNGGRRDVEQTTSANGAVGIDRNTSIRSIVTLPPYRPTAPQSERVLGREGERDGIDTIIDYPTEEHEEALREEEMNAMYRLRQARREHNADSADIRRQRQDAQARRDAHTINHLRQRSRDAQSSQAARVEELRAEINRAKETRQKSASSVAYGDLGVARHDGSRVRANSNESERVGLLSDTASIAAFSAHTRAHSPHGHERGGSRSSVVSMESEFSPPTIPQPTASRPGSQSGAPRTSSHLARHSRAGSSPELVESDLGVESIPPPEYEDVPLGDDDNNSNNSSENQRSTTPLDEPPPDYPGPYRSGSLRSERAAQRNNREGSSSGGRTPTGRGVGGVPQLPSLRISHLPEIVIEPSSAHPRDDDEETSRENVENNRK